MAKLRINENNTKKFGKFLLLSSESKFGEAKGTNKQQYKEN